MAIRKRGAVWWVDFTIPSGERVRRSAETDNKIEAQEYHDRLKAEAWRQDKLEEAPRRTWNEAVPTACADPAAGSSDRRVVIEYKPLSVSIEDDT